jgi:hypothetical protein
MATYAAGVATADPYGGTSARVGRRRRLSPEGLEFRWRRPGVMVAPSWHRCRPAPCPLGAAGCQEAKAWGQDGQSGDSSKVALHRGRRLDALPYQASMSWSTKRSSTSCLGLLPIACRRQVDRRGNMRRYRPPRRRTPSYAHLQEPVQPLGCRDSWRADAISQPFPSLPMVSRGLTRVLRKIAQPNHNASSLTLPMPLTNCVLPQPN